MKKKLLCMLLALTLVAGIASFVSAKVMLSIATAGENSTYHRFGKTLANLITKTGRMTCTAETTGGSVENVRILSDPDERGELAVAQSDVLFMAMHSEAMFLSFPVKNIRALAAIYDEPFFIVATKKSGIKTVKDLKGKRVSLGRVGSGGAADAELLFQAADLDIRKDFQSVLYGNYGVLKSSFLNDQVDAGVIMGIDNLQSVMKTCKNLIVLSIPSSLTSKVIAAHPFFFTKKLAKGSLGSGVGEVLTLSVKAVLVAPAKMANADVSDVLSTLWENVDKFRKLSPELKSLNISQATKGVAIPLHPAAVKFYQAKKVLKNK